ncbi:MAG TPA: cyclic nucleotide-binding domain-containing protein [Polyangiaceae bacterium]|jgi:hypothetical protein
MAEESFVARALRLGEGESPRAVRLVALIFSVSAVLVMIKSAQSGIFLMAYPKTMIPWAFLASAIALSAASLSTVPLASRLGAARLLRVILFACAIALLGVRALVAAHLPGAPFILYVVIEASSGLLLIHGWAVVSQATTARSAKRLLPVVGAGATLAWTFVGLAVVPLSHVFGTPSLLILAAVVLVGLVPLVGTIRGRDLAPHVPTRRAGTIAEWKKSLAYLRAVPLLRVMASLSILALVTEQFMDYVLMTAAHERYATEASCASFFGRYYGITSAVTLAFLLLVSSRIMLGLGTSRTLLLTPVTTIGVAAVAALAPSFGTAVALRSVDRILKQSIWSSASEQTQTPIPPIERVQSRALVRGVLAPGAYALTAAVLAFMPRVSARSLAAATALGVMIMAVVCTRSVRRAYREALRRAIDERTLDLDEIEPKSFDADTRATLLAELRSSDERRAGLAAELLCEGSLAPDDEVLSVAIRSPSALVRAAALRAIARHGRARFAFDVAKLLDADDDATCRAEAARVIVQLGVAPDEARASLARMESKGDPYERAAAKVALRVLAGETDPVELLARFDDESAAIVLDLRVAPGVPTPDALHREMRRIMRRGTDSARLAAVSAAARLRAAELLPDVVALLQDRLGPEVATRIVDWGEDALAYVQDLVDSASAESVRHVASALTQVSRRETGEAAGPILQRLLAHADAEVRDRAVRSLSYAVARGTLARPPDSEIAPLLSRELVAAYKMYAILAGLSKDDGIPDWKIDAPYDQLGAEIENEIGAARERVLHLLALTGKHKLASAVQAGLRRRSAEVDAKIAELVDTTLERDLASRVVPLFEHLSLRERAQAARLFADGVSQIERDPLAAIVELGDDTILGRAMLVYKDRFRDRYPRIWEENSRLIPLFERMAFLRTVPIFEDMPGQELRRVAEILGGVEVASAEIIFKKGDPGDALYIVRRGGVSIKDGAVELSLAKAGDFFGELALLDNEPRSADAIAAEDTSLAKLPGADFRELMARRPQIQERVLRVIVRRLRAASTRITRPS